MQWEFVIALVLAIPIVLFPVAFIWYLNIGGVAVLIREARRRKVARKETADEVVADKQLVK